MPDGKKMQEIHTLKQQLAELERKVAASQTENQAVTAERDLLRMLINVLPDDVFIKDCHGRFVLNNKAHLELMGVESQEQVLGKHDRDFFPAHLASQYHDDEQKILATKKAMIDYEEQVVDRISGKIRWHATSKVPLFDSSGATVGLAGICRDITERKQYQDALCNAKAELEFRVEERTKELQSANSKLQDQIALLYEKARIDDELNAARSIQQKLTPSFRPKIPRVNLKGVYYPAYEVGGDYLDYFQNDEGNWVIAIADVCGKGIPAALLMTMLRATFRVEARSRASARELLCSVNSSVYSTIDSRLFITALCCIVSRDGTTMTYARAGHPPLLQLHAKGGPPERLNLKGQALGLSSDTALFRSTLEETVVPLHTGDRFFMHTDGLIDLASPENVSFGNDSIHSFLASQPPGDADLLITQFMDKVRSFAQGVPFYDDLTMCALNVM